jgi:uncharacterized protein
MSDMEIIKSIIKKIERTFTSLILPVEKCRNGECQQCGACCQLSYPCPFLKHREDKSTFCAVYAMRPPQCRKYPRSKRECETGEGCGYHFSE